MVQAGDIEAIPTCIVVTSSGSNGSFRSRAFYFNSNLIINTIRLHSILGATCTYRWTLNEAKPLWSFRHEYTAAVSLSLLDAHLKPILRGHDKAPVVRAVVPLGVDNIASLEKIREDHLDLDQSKWFAGTGSALQKTVRPDRFRMVNGIGRVHDKRAC
jgi:hypothetical protein